MENDADSEVEDRIYPAKTVYLLMKKDYRISRNIRASWFFNHLNTVLELNPKSEKTEPVEELSVLSVIPEQEDTSDDEKPPLTPNDRFRFQVLPSSVITFLAKTYRLVFVLDMSPSAASVDLKSGTVLVGQLHQALKHCISGLVKPFILPGACVELNPDLYVTVIAYTPVLTCTSNQVLAQGIKVDENNVTEFLNDIKNKLNAFEQVLAAGFGRNSSPSTFNEDDQYIDEDSESVRSNKTKENNADAGIINLLRQGFFALQLLPENSSAGIVVVTDGMLGITDTNLFDSLMTQLRNSTIACSFLKTGDTYCSRCQFGHIPHVELLQFIATATFGAYFSSCPDLSHHSDKQLNVYHKALLLWSFQKGLEGFKYELTHHRTVDPMHPVSLTNRILSHPIKDQIVVMPIVYKKHLETKLNTSIESVLSVRLREGYTIRDVLLSKSGSQLEVRLVLPWRDYAKIEYKAVSSWPVDLSKKTTNVEITIEGSYDFLHDITCPQSKMTWSPIRTANVKKFWITLQRLSQTDQLLVHLQSFGSNPVQFNVPNSVKSGVPVFYQPQSSTTPALNTQHSSKDMELNLFSSFWKPVVNLDIKIWQKWMHSHRIGMVLEHDIPLPKYLHTSNSSGRFSMVSCRQALTSLSFLLRDWSSFVLLEGYSYIKFLYRDPDKPPVSFLLLRVTSKPPCMVLRLAFLGGTTGSMRHKTLQMLKSKVRELKFPQRGSQQISKDKQLGIKQGKPKPAPVIKKPPLQREWSEIGCCVLLTKPVGDILISYENKPRDMTILEDPSRYIPIHITMQQASNKSTMANAFNSLSRYLHHQRWIWTVKQGKVDITLQAIGRILSTLAKIRLQEGFHFASSNAGIVNMVLEVEMVDLSRPQNEIKEPRKCVVQYVMFPPHIKTTRDSVSEEDLNEMETTEADGELQIVTECWIEPQHGTSVNNSPERQHWDGLTYKEIARAFYPKDVECISCLVTFEHLVYVCQNSAIFTSEFSWMLDSCGSNGGFKNLYKEDDTTKQQMPVSPNIYQISFPFDLLSLIPKSQQAELLFSTYFLYPEDFQRNGKGSNRLLFSLLFEKLKDGDQREVTLSLEDCKHFLSLLKARPRKNTTRDLPFPTDEDKMAESEIGINPDITNSKKPGNIKPQRQSSADSTGDLIPKWRCFVRAASNTRLYLTFLPASFDDLLVLNQISISDKFNDRTIEREISVENSQENFKFSTNQPEDAEGQKVTDDQKVNQLEVPEDEDTSATKTSEELPECDNEVSEETTRKDETDTKKMEERKLSVIIPVYVYECFLGNITDSLINPWSFQLSQDIYEDVTFDDENEESNNIMFKLPTLDKEGTPVGEEKDDAFYSSQGLRMSHERRSDSSIDGSGDLRQQCTFLTDIYYICFVNGVFQSLQQGFFVDQHDVDAAINNICEELLPIETDITTFLFTSCRHFQQLVDTSRHDNIVKEVEETSKNDIIPRRPSVRFMDIVEDNEGEMYNKQIPSVLQLPQSTVKLQTSISQPCEYLPGLHSLIQNKFMDIIQKWFRVVPTNPDYFFYCPDILPQDNSIEAVDTDDKQSNNFVSFDISNVEITEDVEELILPEEYDLMEDKKAVDLDITSTASVMDSQDSFIDSDEYDHCEDITEDGNDQQPLFVHFTCTVKSRLDNINVTVQKLVPCIDEILKSVKSIPEFNLGDLKITFDFNCLNLASDDEPETPRKPHFVRMMSNSSVSTSPTNEAESFQFDGASSSETAGPLRQLHGDPIGHLPVLQHNAVMKCKEELEWLFKDEITSALRHMQPIRKDALQFVVDHVKYSVDRGKPNCSTENILLHFVYGAEHSLSRFEEELERINLRSFRFLKEENIYYVIKGKCHNLANHAKQLNSALVELSREGTPAKPSNALQEKWVPHSIDNSVTSPHSDIPLTTYVSPAFISPTFNARDSSLDGSGSHLVISSDLSGHEASPSNYLFLKENMGMLDKFSSGTESDSKDAQKKSSLDIDIRRNSEPNEHILETKLPLPVKSVELRSESLSDEISEGTLKKSSSFAGFMSEENTEPFKRQESMTALSTSPIKGVTNVPQLPSLGRLRHFSAPSGQGTPRSKTSTLPQTPSWISSRGSYTEEGYDGDSSDSEEGATAFNDTNCLQQSLPNFWLVLRVKEDAVEVYYHYRETGQEENEEKLEQRLLLTQVKDSLEDLCRKVNQLLLMNDLYETRMCKKLLVAEADEDVSWNVDRSVIPGRTVSEFSSEEEDDQMTEKQYLAADIHHAPGHFDCDCVFRQTFVVHSRLKTSGGQRRSNVSQGVQVLRQVLNKFSVNNRKNMFVIREMAGNMVVFYVKLKEIVYTGLSRQVSSISTENINLNESSSSLVFHPRKDEQVLDKDSDTFSVCSAGSSTPYLQQDTIELAVHGIQEPGSEIKEDLMRLLQHKLDDAVLDIISLQLSRNPNSKLLSEDVHFIQKPGQEPSDVFCLTIPSSAHMQLPALMYYLKQNMLQFLHTPNYVDNKTESRFQDMVCGKWQAIPDGQVYLYIRPQASGGTGIALVYLSLIDGQGNPVKLLSCPKPSRSGFAKVQEEADFESMVQSEIYCPSPSNRPGPTSLIQFKVWERGSADLKTLKEKLIGAVKYSLCDIVTEYSMLTAPISQVPQQLQDLLPMPACSEPSSPIAHRGSADSSTLERRHSIVTRKLSEHIKTLSNSGGSRSTERRASPSPLQSLKEAFIPKTRIMSPPPDSTKTFDIPCAPHTPLGQTNVATSPLTPKTDREAEIQQIVAKYESGDRGNLHPVYSKILIDWLDYCHKLGVPSVNKSTFTLRSKFSLDYFLREFQTTVTNISGDVKPKIFKLQKDSSGVLFNGIQYNPFRHPIQVGESHNESSLDFERKCFIGAGRDMHFIVVGRNVDQWQASIQDADEEEFCDSSNPTSPKAIPKQTYQKYRPLSSAAQQEKNLDVVGLLPGSGPLFIPRQRFLLLLLENKQLTLYSYNWAGDLSTLITKATKRLTQWNNTRIHVLNSIVSQKMGLFHHILYEDSNQGKDDNPFNSVSTELESLIKQTAPPAREQARRANSLSSLNHPIRPFDAAYKDLIPHKPLHQTQLAIIRDPVAKHGVQALEIRVHDRRDNEKFCKLNNLYWTWLEKTASSIPISDDLIQNLKRSSRLLHYCATPLLFCPSWRQKVMEKYKATQRQVSIVSTSTEKSEIKTRSRHSSGTSNASMRTKRADSQDGKKKPSVTPTDSPVNEAKSRAGQEEPWHAELRHSFVNQYMQYVQSLGFVQVHTRPASPKRGSGRHLKKPSSSGQSTHGPSGLKYYLQKTLSGGIMLMEISFKEQYFCVQLYTCEHTRLCAPINQQLRLLFVDECEKCKDLIHVHSFAHDFHLRCIQTYISGEQIFKQGYHLTGFLSDFMQVYPYPPKFSRNYIHQDVVMETDLPCSGQQLYEFMLQHIKLHQMKVISMLPTVDAEIDTEYYFIRANEYAFIHHKLRGEQVVPQKGLTSKPGEKGILQKTLKSKGDEHSIGLVIFHDSQSVNFQSEAERNTLKLHYFILLTSRRELFPKAMTEKGGFKSMMQELSDLSQPVPVKQHIGIRPHTSKCMRYPVQESPAYQILMEESHLARQKMKDMVTESKTKCRRDYLWQRMLVGDQAEEDGKRKKRSETEDSKDGYLTRLTVEELQSLLDMVVKKPLNEIDKRLMPFYNLSFQWYKSLYKYLLTRYPETHRCFSSADGHIQYIVILNPNLLDMFMMLKINHTDHRTELCAVFREAMTEQEHTPQNPSLPVHSMQTHIEDFVSVCCFHLWSSMI